MKQDMTQRKLSEKTGVHRTTISSIEQRRLKASDKSRILLAETLGGSPEIFFDSNGFAI